MAVKFEDVNKVLRESPLTEEELIIINSSEKYIDHKLKAQYDGNEVTVDSDIPEFKYKPDSNYDQIKSKDIRRQLMSAELKRRYEEAGWKITYESTEDDGPNRPGQDYWVFSGK